MSEPSSPPEGWEIEARDRAGLIRLLGDRILLSVSANTVAVFVDGERVCIIPRMALDYATGLADLDYEASKTPYDWAKLCSSTRERAEALARHYETRLGWTIGATVHYHADDPDRAEWAVHACREYRP